MKQLLWSALFYLLLALSPAQARDFVLSDAETASRTDEWSISSIDLGIAADPPFSVKKTICTAASRKASSWSRSTTVE